MAPGLLLGKWGLNVHQTNTDVEQAREILRYFMQHPQASDDLEGIARWRLLQQHVTRQVEEVRLALELLVQMDLLHQHVNPAIGKRYSLNPERVDESRKFADPTNGETN